MQKSEEVWRLELYKCHTFLAATSRRSTI